MLRPPLDNLAICSHPRTALTMKHLRHEEEAVRYTDLNFSVIVR